MPDFCVRLIKMPPAIKGCVTLDADGFYSIYINDGLSYEAQQETFKHEVAHIQGNHFYSTLPVTELERRANAEAKRS